MDFTPHLVESVAAQVRTAPVGRSLGALLLDLGKIRPSDAELILRMQKERNLRFGEAAIQLGLVTESDIQQALSRQYEFPYLMPGQNLVAPELIAAHQPFSPEVESLRALRTQLMLRWFGTEPRQKTLAVVSTERGDGRSYLAANLAVSFSQLGERTLLVDADLRNPRQHEMFRLNNRPGLSSLLTGRAAGNAIEHVPTFPGLSVLPAGAQAPNPQELAARPSFSAMLHALGNEYDVILIDTPAATLAADAQTIAARAGGALLVARQHRTRMADARALLQSLTSASAVVVGSVLNRF